MFSCIIPAKASNDPKLADLIASIEAQNFSQDQIEILVITEGDSEQAKAIGIRRAQGQICAMFCADNQIMDRDLFTKIKKYIDDGNVAAYPLWYHYRESDNSLNRYFALIGGNDPVCYYLGKNDRFPWVSSLEIDSDYQPSYGCNGFFYRADLIKKTDLDHYYPMDNAKEFIKLAGRNPIGIFSSAIWHRTSDNFFTFLRKRYRYARDLYSDRNDRRWKIIDTREDRWRLAWFVLSTVLIVPALFVSARGFVKLRDWAWAWHWPVCIGFLITYTALAIRNLFEFGNFFQCQLAQ